MEMEANDDNTDKRKGDAQEQGEGRAKRLKCSILVEAFCCNVCTKSLGPLIFQCTEGHLFRSSCHDKLPEEKCTFNSGCTGTVTHSLGMDLAVQSILVDCCHVEHGCTQKTTSYNKKSHELLCPHAPWKMPGAQLLLCREGCGRALGPPHPPSPVAVDLVLVLGAL